nr:MAG TPA: hypothetical protein [Caudoviricetes sp.]
MPKSRQKVEKYFCEFVNKYRVTSAFLASSRYLYLAPHFKTTPLDTLTTIISKI